MLHTISKYFFSVISAVKNNDTVLVNIQSFKAYKMLNGRGALRAKIVLNGSMDNVIVKNRVTK